MEIIASILGGLVGGLFTFLGVLITITHENKTEKKREDCLKREKEELAIKNKPRFEILEFKELHQYSKEDISDASMLLCSIRDYKNKGRCEFYYDKEVLDSNNWISVEYVLQNTGNTEIEYMYFSTNLVKDTSLFNIKNNENEMCYNNKFLNYSVIVEKNIKPRGTVKVKISYISDKIIESNIGNAPITIWMVDENKRWWRQSLFAPCNKIYNSEKSSYQEWRNYTDEGKAMECFVNPMLW